MIIFPKFTLIRLFIPHIIHFPQNIKFDSIFSTWIFFIIKYNFKNKRKLITIFQIIQHSYLFPFQWTILLILKKWKYKILIFLCGFEWLISRKIFKPLLRISYRKGCICEHIFRLWVLIKLTIHIINLLLSCNLHIYIIKL